MTRRDANELGMYQLMRPYGSLSSRARSSVEPEVLAFVNAHGVGPLIAAAEIEAKRARKADSCMCGLGLALWVAGELGQRLIWLNAYTRSAFLLTTAAMYTLMFSYGSRYRRGLLRALSQCEDPRATGLFAEALTSQDRRLTAVSRTVLPRLLPSLTRNDLKQMTRQQLYGLYRGLRYAADLNDQTLGDAFLACYARLDDTGALPLVRWLAAQAPRRRRSAKRRAIAQKAAEVLPVLERAAEARRTPKELLRAAGAAPGGDAALLRAASADCGDDDNLLRAGASAADEVPCAQKSAQ